MGWELEKLTNSAQHRYVKDGEFAMFRKVTTDPWVRNQSHNDEMKKFFKSTAISVSRRAGNDGTNFNTGLLCARDEAAEDGPLHARTYNRGDHVDTLEERRMFRR